MTFSYGNDFVQRRLAYNFLNLLLVCFAQHLFANIGKYEDQLCARGLPKGGWNEIGLIVQDSKTGPTSYLKDRKKLNY